MLRKREGEGALRRRDERIWRREVVLFGDRWPARASLRLVSEVGEGGSESDAVELAAEDDPDFFFLRRRAPLPLPDAGAVAGTRARSSFSVWSAVTWA